MSRVGIAAILTSGRTQKQGRGLEQGKLSKEYRDEVSVCEMDPTTLHVLRIEEGKPVLVQSAHGCVVVRSRIDRRGKPGIVFIPCGPYANMVIDSTTESSGMPDYKGTPVEIFAAEDRVVLSIEELLEEIFGGH
ncbi:molybdopterin dinucleotide-binding protein [Candidatus Thorarchaeota archaeon]|nr:MAG: molybdopterin dinucleotide-binding protein [Candidatus Thorarchaeota archaeon]